ncbi:XRE family transcriptional regulator [Bacillus salacetis]|uniref:XRE family transcriptional regulator n=1 Tax=Bacillus salacetis TaxID=2315464 RepID=A0A3A1R789_9BACI|nr:XRE family transcriptional regulator [Bacillus salacetis]
MFSEAFKRYREEIVQLSQVEVAKRLNISKQLLNKYENGKSQIPNDILRKLVDLYQLSPVDLYSIISGDSYSDQHDESAMLLREKFADGETERALNTLIQYPQLKNLLITASYYDQKKQERFINKLITLIKTIEE